MFCVKWSPDSEFILSGSDEMNVRYVGSPLILVQQKYHIARSYFEVIVKTRLFFCFNSGFGKQRRLQNLER